jgi:replicative DNA helicase
MALNDEDKDILASFVNPDKEQETKYPYDDDFLRMVLGILLCNRFFLNQCMGLIKPTYFRNEIHQLVARILFQYYEKYNQPPSKIFLKDLIEEQLKKKYKVQDDNYRAVRLLYIAELGLIYDYYTKGGVGNMMHIMDSPEAILDRITNFAKIQAIKNAFSRSVDLMRSNPEGDDTWDKIDQFYKEARLVNRQVDLGLNYFETMEERYARLAADAENSEAFTTAFRSSDAAAFGGIRRGELAAVMGETGRGKSVYLAWMSVQNVLAGKKVLYISTEMDPDRIASRFDSQFSVIGQNQLSLRKEEVWHALRDCILDYEDKRRLVIKQFPSGTADMSMLRAYYGQCVSLGFKPDLLIVDYPGDMKAHSNLSSWDSRFRLLTEIRGFGVEEKHGTWVAIHPNRSSKELSLEEFMDETNQGDSFKQSQIFDLFVTLNQTSAEHKANVGRFFMAKVRNGKSRFAFKIRYHFKDQTLRLEEITQGAYMAEMTKMEDSDTDETETIIDRVSVDKPRFRPHDGERIG